MDCQNNLMSDRLLKESNVIAALRWLLESPSMQELGTGMSFLPEVAAAVRNVPEEDVVPKDYHERCMTMVTVPLAPLIGLLLGLSLSGLAAALDNDNILAYVITAILGSGLCVVLACGIEALTNLGGA